MPLPIQNCNFCDRYELYIYRDDSIVKAWDWSSCGERENVCCTELKVDYMLEKLNTRIVDDDDQDGHSPELIESVVQPHLLKFDFLLKVCRNKAQVVCNMLGISEDYASDVAKQLSTFARSQLNNAENSTGCKTVPIVMWFTVYYAQHDGEDVNAARARVRVNSKLAFRQLPPIVPPPNPTTRGVNPLSFQVMYRWILKHDDPMLPVCCICMDEPSIGEVIAILPCWHYFHLNCIIKWLEINNRCPLCSFPLPKNDK